MDVCIVYLLLNGLSVRIVVGGVHIMDELS